MSNKYKAEIKLYKTDLIDILARLFEVSEDDVILDGTVFDENGYVCTVMKTIEVFPDPKDEEPEYVPRDTPIIIPWPFRPTIGDPNPIVNPPYIFTTDTPNTNVATSDPDPLKITYDVDITSVSKSSQ